MMPTISLIMATKDRRKLLERALNSVRRQSVAPDEIVIVNDGSSDYTKNFLSTLSIPHINLRIINKEKNGGMNAARNLAIREASSSWVAWFDDDDELLPDAIKTMKERVASIPPHFNVAYFNSIIDHGDTTTEGGFKFRDGEYSYDPTYADTMTKFNLSGDCKPVFKKTLFNEARYWFPESFAIESYTMNLIARDRKGIRYFREKTTLIHLDRSIVHLTYTGSARNPGRVLVLNMKQLFQHSLFFLSHPRALMNQCMAIIRLTLRVLKINKIIRGIFHV